MAQGTPVRVVADVLGHSTPAITLRTYQHSNPALLREAVADMQAAIGGH